MRIRYLNESIDVDEYQNQLHNALFNVLKDFSIFDLFLELDKYKVTKDHRTFENLTRELTNFFYNISVGLKNYSDEPLPKFSFKYFKTCNTMNALLDQCYYERSLKKLNQVAKDLKELNYPDNPKLNEELCKAFVGIHDFILALQTALDE